MRTGLLSYIRKQKLFQRIGLRLRYFHYKLTRKIKVVTTQQPEKDPLPHLMAKYVLDLSTENENDKLKEWSAKSPRNQYFLEHFVYNKHALSIHSEVWGKLTKDITRNAQQHDSASHTADKLYLLTYTIEKLLEEFFWPPGN